MRLRLCLSLPYVGKDKYGVKKTQSKFVKLKYKLSLDVSKSHTMNQMQMKNYYGTKIYPLVAQIHPKLAGKITGMFLGTGLSEFNQTINNEGYLKSLCENPRFLEKQINEAIEVLESARNLENVRTSVRNKFSKLIFRRVNYIQSHNSKYFLMILLTTYPISEVYSR